MAMDSLIDINVFDYFPGLESYPQHELAKKQMTGFGGMVTFFIKGDLENSKQFFKSSEVHFSLVLLSAVSF